MFAVSDIAPENTGAALPTHSITGTPAQADPGGDRRRAPRLALACFARRAPGNRCLPDMSYILTPAEGIRQVLVPRANGSERTPYDEREGLYCGNSCTRKSAGHCAGSSPLPVTLGQSS
jgi:hypothetical protein